MSRPITDPISNPILIIATIAATVLITSYVLSNPDRAVSDLHRAADRVMTGVAP